MKQITTSPSELLSYNDCARQWYFKYDKRLRLREYRPSPPLASGIAVHYVVETLCRDFPQQLPVPADVRIRAEDSLLSTFDSHPQQGAQVKKFLPGVLRALVKVPDEIWLSDWVLEQDIQGVFANDEIEVTMRGRPDMFRLVGTNRLEIVDLKTTAAEPLEYMLWNPQLRWYAAILAQQYPERLLFYRYQCLPTQGEKPAPQSPPWPFTGRQHQGAIVDILKKAEALHPDITEARESRNCNYCDFNPICQAIIGGADPTGVAKELFYVRK